jgi:hypothetical protein
LLRRRRQTIAAKYLLAVQEAGKSIVISFRPRARAPSSPRFPWTKRQPRTPPELLIILAALADEGIPLQTIAPKFTGRFNKGGLRRRPGAV